MVTGDGNSQDRVPPLDVTPETEGEREALRAWRKQSRRYRRRALALFIIGPLIGVVLTAAPPTDYFLGLLTAAAAILGYLAIRVLIDQSVGPRRLKSYFVNHDSEAALTGLIEDLRSPSMPIRFAAAHQISAHLNRRGLELVRELNPRQRGRLYYAIERYDWPLGPTIARLLTDEPDPLALPSLRLALKIPLWRRLYPEAHQLYVQCEQAIVAATASGNHPSELLRGSAAPQDNSTLLQPAHGAQLEQAKMLMRAAHRNDEA
jgi:hypothetical protein